MVRRFFLAWIARLTRAMAYSPSNRRTTRASPGPTASMPSIRRRRDPDFLRRKWFPVALRCSTLPFRVTRNRLAAPRCVFCFISPSSSRSRLLRLRLQRRGWLGRGLRRGLGPGPGPASRGRRLGPGGLSLRWGHHHHHVAAVELREAVDLGDVAEVGHEPVEDPAPELGVGHL